MLQLIYNLSTALILTLDTIQHSPLYCPLSTATPSSPATTLTTLFLQLHLYLIATELIEENNGVFTNSWKAIFQVILSHYLCAESLVKQREGLR